MDSIFYQAYRHGVFEFSTNKRWTAVDQRDLDGFVRKRTYGPFILETVTDLLFSTGPSGTYHAFRIITDQGTSIGHTLIPITTNKPPRPVSTRSRLMTLKIHVFTGVDGESHLGIEEIDTLTEDIRRLKRSGRRRGIVKRPMIRKRIIADIKIARKQLTAINGGFSPISNKEMALLANAPECTLRRILRILLSKISPVGRRHVLMPGVVYMFGGHPANDHTLELASVLDFLEISDH